MTDRDTPTEANPAAAAAGADASRPRLENDAKTTPRDPESTSIPPQANPAEAVVTSKPRALTPRS